MNTNTMNKALQTLIDNMPEKTGKSLEEWKVLLKKRRLQNTVKLSIF